MFFMKLLREYLFQPVLVSRFSLLSSAMPKHASLQLHKAVVNFARQRKICHKIANWLLIDKGTVNRIIAKYQLTDFLADKPRSGRPRKSTKRINKMFKRK